MDSDATWMERYFENSLSASELEQFQRRLKEDPAFAQAFELEKDLMEGIETLGNESLREELGEIYKEEILTQQSSEPTIGPIDKRRTISRRWWLLAAAVLAGIVLYLWPFQRDTPERLYAQYFQPEFDFVEKGSTQELIAQAEAALKTGEYQKALPILDELLELEPESSKYILAKAIALMELNRFEDAEALMLQAQVNNPGYTSEVSWYQALAFLKQKNLSEAINRLNQIPATSARAQDAQALSQAIKDLSN